MEQPEPTPVRTLTWQAFEAAPEGPERDALGIAFARQQLEFLLSQLEPGRVTLENVSTALRNLAIDLVIGRGKLVLKAAPETPLRSEDFPPRT